MDVDVEFENALGIGLSAIRIPEIRIKELVHLSFAFSFFGHSLFGARLGGEAQVITEPYEAKPCESCSGAHPSLVPPRLSA